MQSDSQHDRNDSKPCDSEEHSFSPQSVNQPNLQLTPGLATIITASLGLNCLAEIRKYYPSALPDSEATELHRDLVDSIELWLSSESGERFKTVYERPSFADITNESITLLLEFVVLNTVEQVPESELVRATNRLVHRAQEEAMEPVKTIMHRLSEVEVFGCREIDPAANSDFADPRRALYLLSKYWAIVRHLVCIDSESYSYRAPHPLLAVIVNVGERIDGCLRQLQMVAGCEEAQSTIESFVSILGSSDVVDLQNFPDRTNQGLATVELFLERSRLQLGLKTFQLTRAEESFFSLADLQLSRYEQEVAKDDKRVPFATLSRFFAAKSTGYFAVTVAT